MLAASHGNLTVPLISYTQIISAQTLILLNNQFAQTGVSEIGIKTY